MQLGLLALAVVFLSSSIGHGNHGNLRDGKGRRQRRISTEVPPSCSKGCENCSEYNGCLKCLPRLFFLLERNDIRQTGVCLASCPVGYFGIRTPEMNKCAQCKIENCEECFSRTFCTKCKEGLYSHRGRCYASCPEGHSTANGTMECVVQCELGEWGAWGPCMKKNKTCGFKKGAQTRTREPLQPPSPDTASRPPPSSACPPETETQRCTVRKRVQCVTGGGKRRNEKQDGQRNRDKPSGKNRSRENKGTAGGGAGGAGGGGDGGGGGGGGKGGGGGGGGGGAGGGGGGRKKKLRATTVPAPILTASTVT